MQNKVHAKASAIFSTQKIQWNGVTTLQDVTEIPQKLMNEINI